MALASSIAHIEHIAALHDTVEERIEAIPVEVVMTYLFQILEESAMPTMATDFIVNGVGGFAQAPTVQDKRNVLINAFKIRSRMGTVGSVKKSIQTLGYSEPIILEGGTAYFVDQHWANFIVVLPEAELISLTADEIDLLVQYINHYKNERSNLLGVGYYDAVLPVYDATFGHDGELDYSGNPAGSITFVT